MDACYLNSRIIIYPESLRVKPPTLRAMGKVNAILDSIESFLIQNYSKFILLSIKIEACT